MARRCEFPSETDSHLYRNSAEEIMKNQDTGIDEMESFEVFTGRNHRTAAWPVHHSRMR